MPNIKYDYTKENQVKEFHYAKSEFSIAKTLDTSSPAIDIQKKYYKRIPKAFGVKVGLRSILYNDLGSSDLVTTVQLISQKQKDQIARKTKHITDLPYSVEDGLLTNNYTYEKDTTNYLINDMIIPFNEKYIRICSITYDGFDKKIYPYLEDEIIVPLKNNVFN